MRAALHGDELAEYEQEYRASLAKAAADYDLAPVHAVIERWWRVAVLESDAAAHQRMLAAVADIRAGRAVRGTPWRQVRAEMDI